MKKSFSFSIGGFTVLMLLCIALVFTATTFADPTPVGVIAQADTSLVEVSIEDLITEPLASFFESLGVLVGLILVVFQFINDKLLKYKANKTWTMVLTWVLSLVLSYVGYLFGYGIFENLALWEFIVTAFAAGLVANGLFRLTLVKKVLDILQLMKNYKWKTQAEYIK